VEEQVYITFPGAVSLLFDKQNLICVLIKVFLILDVESDALHGLTFLVLPDYNQVVTEVYELTCSTNIEFIGPVVLATALWLPNVAYEMDVAV
jgi:hypothetical protein